MTALGCGFNNSYAKLNPLIFRLHRILHRKAFRKFTGLAGHARADGRRFPGRRHDRDQGKEANLARSRDKYRLSDRIIIVG